MSTVSDEVVRTFHAHEVSWLLHASVVVAAAHDGQTRREIDEPYILHPLKAAAHAAAAMLPVHAIIAALAHDVLEDCGKQWLPRLENDHVFKPSMPLIHALTKWWKNDVSPDTIAANKMIYYDRIIKTPLAPELKLLDRGENLRDAVRTWQAGGDRKWVSRYVAKTVREFSPVLNAQSNPYVTDFYTDALNAALLTVGRD